MPKIFEDNAAFSRSHYGIDWDKLTNGKSYILESGKDFPIGTSLVSVQTSARQAAARRGMKARTCVVADTVVVQFYK